LIERVKEQYAKGHIITLMWHGCFPTDGHECMGETIWAMGKTPSEQEWMDLITEGTEINTAWKAQVDVIAGYLKQLQDAHIPVLWRPYHEMNGVWFWWCNKQGENGFPKLWNMMYDRFTNYHHLNNLIWVWNTNAPRDIPGDEAHPYKLFYPGNETVDVLAADVYRNDYKQSHHDDLLTLGNNKLIALGEVGNAPAPDILTRQPNWSWFMIWAYLVNGFGNSQEAFKATINDPSVITLDEVSRDAKGRYELNLQ
jgi:mannan endo-1,4-beta-mannosidase